MDTTEKVNSDNSVTNKTVLLSKFYTYSLPRDQTPLNAYFTIEKLADSLKSIGSPIPDDQIVAKVMAALPSKYNHFRNAWQSVPNTDQTMGNLLSRLKIEELTNPPWKSEKMEHLESAYVAKPKPGKRFNKNSKNEKGEEEEDADNRDGDPKAKPKKKCDFCNRIGHSMDQCFKLKKKKIEETLTRDE